jgi:hypothetical protein
MAAAGDEFFTDGQLDAQALQGALSTDREDSMQILQDAIQAGMDAVYVHAQDLGDVSGGIQDMASKIMQVVVTFAQENGLDAEQWVQSAAYQMSWAAQEHASKLTGVEQDGVNAAVDSGLQSGAGDFQQAAVQGVDRSQVRKERGFPDKTELQERAREFRQERGRQASPSQ